MLRCLFLVPMLIASLLAGCATTTAPAGTDYPGLAEEITRIIERKAFAPTGLLHRWPEALAEVDATAQNLQPALFAVQMNHALDQLGVSAFELIAPTEQFAPRPASIAWLDSRVALIRIPSLETDHYERRPVERLFEAAFWARGIVIDLRGTGGSAPGAAEHLAGMVLQPGKPVGRILEPAEYNAYLRQLKEASPSLTDAGAYAADRLNALPSHVLPQAYGGEVAVLVDRNTRGAGELVAATIQAALRGPVLGESTDGYGYETRTVRLSGGWELEYPVALVFDAKGAPREAQSIFPNIAIPPEQMADTAALWKALREFGKPLHR